MNRSSILRVPRRAGLLAGATRAALALFGGGIAAAAVTGHTGNTVNRLAVVTQDTANAYTGTTWTPVGSLRIYARAGQFITTTFTAESQCSGTGGGWCSVRILIDGVEAEPVVGSDFAFDNAEPGSTWESHSVARVRTVRTTGWHTVLVQATQVGPSTERLDDWTLQALTATP